MTIKYENLIGKKLGVDLKAFKEKYEMFDKETQVEELKGLLSILDIHNDPKSKLAIGSPSTKHYTELLEFLLKEGVIKITEDSTIQAKATEDIITEPEATEDKKVKYQDLIGKKLTLDQDAPTKGIEQTKIDELNFLIEAHNDYGMSTARGGVTKSMSEPIEHWVAEGLIQVGGNVHVEKYKKLVGKKLKLDVVELNKRVVHESGFDPVELDMFRLSSKSAKVNAQTDKMKIYLKNIINHHNYDEQGITELTPDIAQSAPDRVSDFPELCWDIENCLRSGLLYIEEEQHSVDDSLYQF